MDGKGVPFSGEGFVFPSKQEWPHFWGHSLKRQWKVMSGKAMHETVPPAGTANWEKLNAMESEGHGALCGLFYYR
jgi:hypothetical protein